jgi:hypothetical protein
MMPEEGRPMQPLNVQVGSRLPKGASTILRRLKFYEPRGPEIKRPPRETAQFPLVSMVSSPGAGRDSINCRSSPISLSYRSSRRDIRDNNEFGGKGCLANGRRR